MPLCRECFVISRLFYAKFPCKRGSNGYTFVKLSGTVSGGCTKKSLIKNGLLCIE